MGIKIFSSFDTDFKQKLVNKEIERYWKDKVYVVSHGRFYYYFYIILPTIVLFLWTILFFWVLYYLSSSLNWDWKTVIIWVGIVLWIVVFVPVILKLIKKYIDYILDFLIVTPESLIYYNQEGIFTRRWRTVDVEKIKTITVNKNWFLRSLFNFWNIVILTEWDEKGVWEINFSFIDDPDNVKFKILEITGKGS
jgi:uncharacterized membrane protein YdbT with pleckstrin-like domain